MQGGSRKTQQIGFIIVSAILAGYLLYQGLRRSEVRVDVNSLTSNSQAGKTSSDSRPLQLIDKELAKAGFAANSDASIVLVRTTESGDGYIYALAKTKIAIQKNSLRQLQRTAVEIDSFCVLLEQDPRSLNLTSFPEALLLLALKIDSTDINSLNTLALHKIYRQDRIMEGVKTLLKVVKLDSNNEDALYQLGLLALKSGQADKAIERFRKLISLQPLKKEYHQQLAFLYSQKGDTKNAEKHAVLAR